VNQVLEVRYKYPIWGAKKIRAKLEQSNAAIGWPAVSTVGEILKRAGLVCKSTPAPCHGFRRTLL
jgi:hypothetical protein